MVVVGVFPHKPIDATINFNDTFHILHGIIASVAGILITIGFIWQGFRTNGRQRVICFYMAAIAILFPILMLTIPYYRGIIQRIMYLQVFGWLWMKYPIIFAKQSLYSAPEQQRK